MKSLLVLFVALMSINAQLAAIVTSHSLFSLALAAAQDEKEKTGGKFRDESLKAILAAQWDLLPEVTSAQKDAKKQGRLNFYKIFGSYPDQIDLTKMSQYVNLSELSRQSESKLQDQISTLQKNVETLTKERKQLSTESESHKSSLSELSAALNAYSHDFQGLFVALEKSEQAHTLQAGDLSSRELADLKTNLLNAQTAYNNALKDLHAKAKKFNLDVDLTDTYLDLIIKGELLKYGETQTPEEPSK